MSTLVGYMLAGILVGPYTPGFVADANLATVCAIGEDLDALEEERKPGATMVFGNASRVDVLKAAGAEGARSGGRCRPRPTPRRIGG